MMILIFRHAAIIASKLTPRPLKKPIKQLFFAKKVLVLGDSHAGIFGYLNHLQTHPEGLLRLLKKPPFFVVASVAGATINGLSNINSKSGASKRFKNALAQYKTSTVITLLGEVDLAFLIWYRAKKHNTSVSNMLNETYQNYCMFLLELAKTRQVICVSAPLPTQKNNPHLMWLGTRFESNKSLLQAASSVTKEQVNNLTLKFNSLMNDFCKNNAITFVSLDQDSLGDDGFVHTKLTSSIPGNHHYDTKIYGAILWPHLKKALSQTGDI